MILHVDVETRSTVDLKKVGAHAYAQHPSTDVRVMSYAFDDEPVVRWRPGMSLLQRIVDHIELGGVLSAQNAAFERVIFRYILTPRYEWPEPDVTQWRCTMATGLAMALPGSLEHMGAALGSTIQKDKAGHRLMLAMCKPRRPRKGEPDGVYWRDDPADIERLGAYCDDDVESERANDKRLVRLRKSELDLWHLDQVINDRGIPVDANLCHKALAIVDAHTKVLDAQMNHATDYAVTACSNVGQLTTWLRQQGVEPGQRLDKKTLRYVDTLAKEFVVELLQGDLPDPARRALELRQEAGKASVTKIKALLNGMSSDGRARGLMQYHAASTGRWGGRRFQPQNLVRPDESYDIGAIIDTIENLSTQDAVNELDTFHGPPLTCVSYILRGLVRAEWGHKIMAADFKSIEGVTLAWLAGETWKVEAYREAFAKTGPEIYKLTAGEILGKRPDEVTKEERQAYGKVPELALGYQGGVGAFQTMAHTHGVKMADEQADAIKNRWRDKHPRIQQFWYGVEEAAIRAVRTPGRIFDCGPVRYRMAGSFLWCQLPSGRALCYPYPVVMTLPTPWGQDKDMLTYKRAPNISNVRKIVHQDQSNTSKWARTSTYGGELAENITQGVARDILAGAMFRAEAENYPVILTVHDECVSEVPEEFGSVHAYEQIMSELPGWAAGLPIAAEGFEAERYRK